MALASDLAVSDAVGLAILTALNITDEFSGPNRPSDTLGHPGGARRGAGEHGRPGARPRRKRSSCSLPGSALFCPLFLAFVVFFALRLTAGAPGT